MASTRRTSERWRPRLSVKGGGKQADSELHAMFQLPRGKGNCIRCSKPRRIRRWGSTARALAKRASASPMEWGHSWQGSFIDETVIARRFQSHDLAGRG